MKQQSAPPQNVMEILQEHDELSHFVRGLYDTGLRSYIANSDGPITVFAPLNSAFEKLSPERFDALFRNSNRETLRRVLNAHVVPRKIHSSSFKDARIATLGDTAVSCEIDEYHRKYGGGRITRTDIRAANGLIHTIDKVVLPPAIDAQLIHGGR